MALRAGVTGAHETSGTVLHRAAGYDLLIWLITRGRERAFREKLVGLAHLASGETILDVGCGTGTLAIAATRHVGRAGRVWGIDASAEMIARATRKARKSGVDVTFLKACAETLPFPDAQFDVVLSTVTLHHLSRSTRQRATREIRRVLKPGGRVLIVDFGSSEPRTHGIAGRFHRHGHVDEADVVAMLQDAGLTARQRGEVGLFDLNFVLATAPCCSSSSSR